MKHENKSNKFTPGPWSFDGLGILMSKATKEVLARDIQNPDDARLIATAPELLELLETAFRRLEEKSGNSNRDVGLLVSIKATLAKATGGAE